MAIENPYVGPAPIAEGTPLYGRDDEMRDLYHLLLNERIVLLYSPSGAGKTSLIQAGLMPQLRRDPALRPFRIDGLAVGAAGAGLGVPNRYLSSLVGQVEEALPQGQRGRFDWHAPRASLRAYLDWVRGAAERDDRRQGEVLLLDHFEDLLLDPHDRQEKQAFFRELGHTLTDRSRHALFSMGERHIAELDEYLHLVPTSLARRFRLGLLGRRQARQAITGPAGDRQVRYEPRALAGLMLKLRTSIDSRGADGSRRLILSEWVEPVQLQVACRRLWATKFAPPAVPPGIIGAADVETFSVESALEDYYAATAKLAALAAPPIPERDVREWIEDRLILPSGVRGQAPREDTTGLHLPERATEVLRKEQLVRLQIFGDSRWYELANDRLVEPIRRNNRQWFASLAPLQRKAREWARANRPDRSLLSVPEFLVEWRWRRAHDNQLRPDEREFWQRSRRSLLFMRVGPAVGVLALVVLAGWGWWSTQLATVERFAREQQQMLVKLGNVEEQALRRSLDSALIDGALTANEVDRLPQGDARRTLEFSVRASLMSVLRAARNLRKLIVHDDVRLKAVAVRPGHADPLFAYGGTGGKVWLMDANGLFVGNYAVACSPRTDVKSLAFNSQGTLLAVGCEDGTVSVWSTSAWERRGEWQAHSPRRTLTVAFNRHGTALASGGLDNTIKVMPLAKDGTPDLPALEALKAAGNFSGGIWAVTFSPTEDFLVAGDGVGNLWLCHAGESGKCDLKQPGRPDLLPGENDAVIAVAFSGDGACIATGTFKGSVKLWGRFLASSGQEVEPDEAAAHSLAFTKLANARQLAVGRSNRLRFIGVDTATCKVDARASGGRVGARPLLVGDEITGVAFHDESGLIAATTGVGYLALIDVDSQNDRVRLPPVPVHEGTPVKAGDGWRGALAEDDPTGSRFVVGRRGDDRLFVVRLGKDGRTGIDEPVQSEQVGIHRVTASVARKRVVTLGQNGTIKFWTLAAQLVPDPGVQPLMSAMKHVNDVARKGAQPLPLPELADGSQQTPTRILLSPNGDLLACLFKDSKGVLMVNLADPSASKWEPTEAPGREIAFSPDGTLFATGAKRVWVWNVRSGQLELRPTKEPMQLTGLASEVAELALVSTRDGKTLVTAGGANGQIFVWNAQTGHSMQKLRADSRQIEQMTFLPSNGLFATADEYGRVNLWDTGDWQPVELTTPLDKIQKTRFLSFASSGGFLVSGTDDLIVWDIDVRSLRAKVCDILGAGNSPSASKRVAEACSPILPPPSKWWHFRFLSPFY